MRTVFPLSVAMGGVLLASSNSLKGRCTSSAASLWTHDYNNLQYLILQYPSRYSILYHSTPTVPVGSEQISQTRRLVGAENWENCDCVLCSQWEKVARAGCKRLTPLKAPNTIDLIDDLPYSSNNMHRDMPLMTYTTSTVLLQYLLSEESVKSIGLFGGYSFE